MAAWVTGNAAVAVCLFVSCTLLHAMATWEWCSYCSVTLRSSALSTTMAGNLYTALFAGDRSIYPSVSFL